MPYPPIWAYTDDSQFSARPFFSQSPIKSIQDDSVAKVPIMIGFTKEDGLLPSGTFIKYPQIFENFK